MAKSGFVKTIQKNSPFKNLSTAFITLALLFIVSIILYFVFNKHSLENLDNLDNLDNNTTENYDNNDTIIEGAVGHARGGKGKKKEIKNKGPQLKK